MLRQLKEAWRLILGMIIIIVALISINYKSSTLNATGYHVKFWIGNTSFEVNNKGR